MALGRTDESVHAGTIARAQARLDAVELQARYLRDVSRYVAQRIPEREEAEDITAEVFAAAFAALSRFRGDCDPRLWLLSIARRKIVNSVRRKKTRPPSLSQQALSQESDATEHAAALPEAVAASSANPQLAVERAEARQAIRKLMQELKEEQREALQLKYGDELSINEISIVMERSPAAVNSLLQRARKTLFERGRPYFLELDNEVTP